MVISGIKKNCTKTVATSLMRLGSCGCIPTQKIDVAKHIMELHNNFYRFQSEDNDLSEVSSKIQECSSPEEISHLFSQNLFYSMVCMVTEEMTDRTIDPMVRRTRHDLGEKLRVLYNCDRDIDPEKPEFIRTCEIMPDLDKIFEKCQPVILTALHQMEIPLGYLAFCYDEPLLSNYMKVGQIQIALSSALGSYRSIQYQKHLQETYRYDNLTGLLTRSAFLRQLLKQRNPERPITLILCDLDGLKYINDHFNHHEGDNAISVVAGALYDSCRSGLCCRYGGDELIAVIWDSTLPESIINVSVNYG